MQKVLHLGEKEEPLATGKSGVWREQFYRKEAGAQQAEKKPVFNEESQHHPALYSLPVSTV